MQRTAEQSRAEQNLSSLPIIEERGRKRQQQHHLYDGCKEWPTKRLGAKKKKKKPDRWLQGFGEKVEDKWGRERELRVKL